jgi:hypothetical protein
MLIGLFKLLIIRSFLLACSLLTGLDAIGWTANGKCDR